MIQQRKVHDMNWFEKNCKQQINYSDYIFENFYIPNKNKSYKYPFNIGKMSKWAEKIVNWNIINFHIEEDPEQYWVFDEWMFEPV